MKESIKITKTLSADWKVQGRKQPSPDIRHQPDIKVLGTIPDKYLVEIERSYIAIWAEGGGQEKTIQPIDWSCTMAHSKSPDPLDESWRMIAHHRHKNFPVVRIKFGKELLAIG